MEILNVFNLGFKVDNGCGLMVEGGGVLHQRRGAWRLGCGGANWEAAGLGLAARPEEDEGGQAPVVRDRRGGWASGSGSGLGVLGRPAGQGRRSGWAGWAGKEKKKEIH
jgi:hypothetical protein